VVRVNNNDNGSLPSNIPYCNLSESQFSFHGHRNAIKFFLNVPIEAIQKMHRTTIAGKPKEEYYEKVETMLVLSGGHGYIDFRIGDTAKNLQEKTKEQRYDDIKAEAIVNKPILNKHERSHLIVWQLNNNTNNNNNSSN
jgi:hypothetical protein